MRILHTSDWHLGKKLFKLDRSSEHEHFLSWLLKTLIEQEIDLLIIAGDIFDTPTPPHQSLEMFYNFLHEISIKTKTETFIIAGNHDSGLLLEAPARLLSFHRVKVWGKLSPDPKDHWVRFEKNNETLDICALPFFRSYELLPQGEGDALEALKKYFSKEKNGPQLLMLHHLAGIFEAAGSEQVISLSGVETIPKDLLTSFDYVALGHIHKPQRIGEGMYYSGSPIPLRFSEGKEKSVVILNLNEKKMTCEIYAIPLSRQLLIIKATDENWREKIQALEIQGTLPPMAEVQITLETPRSGLIEEIKVELNKKGVELLSYLPSFNGQEKSKKRNHKLFELSAMELFEEFYLTKFPDSEIVPAELKADFAKLIEKVKHAPSET